MQIGLAETIGPTADRHCVPCRYALSVSAADLRRLDARSDTGTLVLHTNELKADAFTGSLARAATARDNITQLMTPIDELITKSPKARFPLGQAHDGNNWTANAPVPLARKADRRSRFGLAGYWRHRSSISGNPTRLNSGHRSRAVALISQSIRTRRVTSFPIAPTQKPSANDWLIRAALLARLQTIAVGQDSET